MTALWIDVAGSEHLATLVRLHADYRVEDGLAPADEVARGAIEPLLLDRSRGMILVAGQGREVVAYAVLTWGWGLESGGREGLLDELYVAPPHRAHGVGGRLVERVVEAARGAHCRTLFLETEKANEGARRLYARHGLTEQDSIWMSMELEGAPGGGADD